MKHRLKRPPVLAAGVAAALIASAALSMAPAVAGETRGTDALVANPATLVNPFIGTGSRSGRLVDSGHTFPGSVMPYGMIQWSPDTDPTRVNGGGYWYDSSKISGFSLDHLSGAGCPVYGDIPILPMVGAIPANPSEATVKFSHNDEVATAGYYEVTTTSPATTARVKTRLTTTTRAGIAEFEFPESTQSNLLLKVKDSSMKLVAEGGQTKPKYDKVTGTTAQVVGDREVVGSVTVGGFCSNQDRQRPYTLHFDIVFDQPFTSSGTWGTSPNGGPGGVHLTFDTTAHRTVTAKVGISYTSAPNARLNLDTEIPHWDFGSVLAANVAAWNENLSKIQIAGGTRDEQVQFYSSLYHVLLDPHVFSDVNGEYTGFDGLVHKTQPGREQYADFSGWDIYRTQIPLLAIIDSKRTSDMVVSMLNTYDQVGTLPKWSQANGETNTMTGDPADPIIAGAYAFGARDFDAEHALEAMVAQATKPNTIRPGQGTLDTYGYLPQGLSYGCCNFNGTVATQMEYNIADYSIASFAKALRHNSTYRTFATRAQTWQNLFNPATGYVQARRATGEWVAGFAPESTTGMVEGTAAQYTPMLPFNIGALVEGRGGTAAWEAFLDSLFENIVTPGPTNADIGNEPSFWTPWQYNYTGSPWKTQQLVRRMQTELFDSSPAGLPGNDDLGSLGSWYVFSALGIFPMVPGTDTMVIGSPMFPRAVIHLSNGRDITITAPKATKDAPFVQHLLLNGSAWTKTFLTGSQLKNGAELTFELATTPDRGWGTGAQAAPPSDATGLVPATPYLTTPEITVKPGSSTRVTIHGQNLTGKPVTVEVAATPPNGAPVQIQPESSTLQLRSGSGQFSATVTVSDSARSSDVIVPITFRPKPDSSSSTSVTLKVRIRP